MERLGDIDNARTTTTTFEDLDPRRGRMLRQQNAQSRG